MRNLAAIALIVFYLAVYILPLGVRPLAIIDEARYAEIPREMLASGDWTTPKLNGLRYFEKPVLGYWMNALSIKAFGENAFAARFPSAVAAGLSVLVIFLFVRRFYQSRTAGFLAAAVLMTSVLPFVVAVTSVLDSMFTFSITATLATFFGAYESKKRSSCVGWLIACGFFAGLAFLVKGFLALALPCVTVVPFLLWERQWRRLFTLPWIPLLTAFLVVLPWGIAIHRAEPDFWNYFVFVEHFQRFLPGNPQHPEPFWFFVPILLAGFIPWTLLFWAIIKGQKQIQPPPAFFRFVICWFVFPFLFFSASSGKLGTYILPCFPPLAILSSVGLIGLIKSGNLRSFQVPIYILASLTIVGAVLVVVGDVLEFQHHPFNEAEHRHQLLLATGLVCWCGLLIFAARLTDFRKKLLVFCLAPTVFFLNVNWAIPDKLVVARSAEAFLRSNAQYVKDTTLVFTDAQLVHSVCFFYKRNNVYLLSSRGELSYGLRYPDAKGRLMSNEEFKELVLNQKGKHDIVFITSTKRLGDYKNLPPPVYQSQNGSLLFFQF